MHYNLHTCAGMLFTGSDVPNGLVSWESVLRRYRTTLSELKFLFRYHQCVRSVRRTSSWHRSRICYANPTILGGSEAYDFREMSNLHLIKSPDRKVWPPDHHLSKYVSMALTVVPTLITSAPYYYPPEWCHVGERLLEKSAATLLWRRLELDDVKVISGVPEHRDDICRPNMRISGMGLLQADSSTTNWMLLAILQLAHVQSLRRGLEPNIHSSGALFGEFQAWLLTQHRSPHCQGRHESNNTKAERTHTTLRQNIMTIATKAQPIIINLSEDLLYVTDAVL